MVPGVLTKEFLAMTARLGTAAARCGGLHSCLAEAQCIDIAKKLQEVSSESLATLRGGTCTEQSIQEAVAAVDHALNEARRYCIQKSIGRRMFERIW